MAFRHALLVRHGISRDPTGRPRGLKIESASDAVDIEQFAREIKARTNPALHRLEIDFFERYAAASNELILVQTFSRNLQFSSGDLSGQSIDGIS